MEKQEAKNTTAEIEKKRDRRGKREGSYKKRRKGRRLQSVKNINDVHHDREPRERERESYEERDQQLYF